jgi:hypothetical protein
MTYRSVALAVLLMSLTLAACGSTEPTKTVVTIVKEVTASSNDASGDDKSSSTEDTENFESDDEQSADDSDSAEITVPDVVGMDHQDAQNKMQDVGLFNLDEEDATGQGRLLILDHNWEVVRQKPAAGSRVTDDTTILLISKKKGE